MKLGLPTRATTQPQEEKEKNLMHVIWGHELMYNMLHHICVLIYDLTSQDLEPYNIPYIYATSN